MRLKTFLVASLVGAIAIFVFTGAIFVPLSGFFAANMTAPAVLRPQPIVWSIGVSCVAEAALICFVLGRAGAAGTATGAVNGVVVGLLLWVTANFSWYALMNVFNLTSAVVNPMGDAMVAGLAGAVIGRVVVKMELGNGTRP